MALSISFSTLVTSLLMQYVLYSIAICVYRLFFHPLSKFPGPTVAACTLWYEAYYDIYLGGRFTWQIEKMHERYGPIVRISPFELHVNDPEFISSVYPASSKKVDKYGWFTGQFGTPDSAFGTVSHDLHRKRRNALGTFFSGASIARLESRIKEKVQLMCQRIDAQYVGTGKPLYLIRAFSCMTTDIMSEYAFNTCYNFLDSPGFETNLHDALAAGIQMGPTMRHFPWLGALMRALPHSIMRRLDPGLSGFLDLQALMKRQIREIHQQKQSDSDTKEDNASNIFEAVIYGPLPADEKSVERLWQEGQAVIAAGTETTAHALEVLIFYILSNPTVLATLTSHLATAIPDPSNLPTWTTLDSTPYIRATITEGLRLSYGVPTRLARIPHNPLIYQPSPSTSPSTPAKSYIIPPGHPVGMSAYLIHNNATIFPQPEKFLPERWLQEDGTFNAHLQQSYLLAFSKGTRQCLGITLAYAELYLGLAAMIRHYGHRMRLHDTTFQQDIECVQDLVVPVPRRRRGVQVIIS